MKSIIIFTMLLFSIPCHSQVLKGIHNKGPEKETIFQVRKNADAAFVLNVNSIVLDTCNALSSEKTFVVTGKVIKKYFDKTGKFKDIKITYLTTDTAPYTKDPYHIVFVNQASEELTNKCYGIKWISKPANAFVFSAKTENLISKKEE